MSAKTLKKAALAGLVFLPVAAFEAVFPWPAFPRDFAEKGVTVQRAAPLHMMQMRLAGAYQAFMQGDIQGAEQGYGEILADSPDNRDALLGQAAIAMLRGETAMAAARYQRLLDRDPGDVVAQAILLSLSMDFPWSEGRLRTLLRRHPGADFLHYILGNLYAAQYRWPEARHSFLSALRLDPLNPDYAYNLAVTLEHLREVRGASEYYQRALALGESRPGVFVRERVKNRLAELAGEKEP